MLPELNSWLYSKKQGSTDIYKKDNYFVIILELRNLPVDDKLGWFHKPRVHWRPSKFPFRTVTMPRCTLKKCNSVPRPQSFLPQRMLSEKESARKTSAPIFSLSHFEHLFSLNEAQVTCSTGVGIRTRQGVHGVPGHTIPNLRAFLSRYAANFHDTFSFKKLPET